MAFVPAGPMSPEQLDRAQQCAMLPQLRTALYSLMSGQQRQQTRDGDRWSTWHAGNVRELRAEIRKLEALCLGCGRGSVRAGPQHPPMGWGIGPRRSFF